MPLSFGTISLGKIPTLYRAEWYRRVVQFLLSLEWTDCKMLEEKEENNVM